MKPLIVTMILMVAIAFVGANAVLDENVGLGIITVVTVWALLPVAFRQAAVAERHEQRLSGK
jgi:hypothetical protein